MRPEIIFCDNLLILFVPGEEERRTEDYGGATVSAAACEGRLEITELVRDGAKNHPE